MKVLYSLVTVAVLPVLVADCSGAGSDSAEVLVELDQQIQLAAANGDTSSLLRLHANVRDASDEMRTAVDSGRAYRALALADYALVLARGRAGGEEMQRRAAEGLEHAEAAVAADPRDERAIALEVLSLWMAARTGAASTGNPMAEAGKTLQAALARAPGSPYLGMVDGLGKGVSASGIAQPAGIERLDEAAREFRARGRSGGDVWWRVQTLTWLGGMYLNTDSPDPAAAHRVLSEALEAVPAAKMVRDLYMPQTERQTLELPPADRAWTVVEQELAPDGQNPSLPDAQRLAVWASGAWVWFKIDLQALPDSTRFGINLVLDTDLDQATGRPWWGTGSSFTFDRLVTAWVVRDNQQGFWGITGVANADAAIAQDLSSDSRNRLRLSVDGDGEILYLGVQRADLDEDGRFRVVAAVGSNTFWNDDLPDSGWADVDLVRGAGDPVAFEHVQLFDGDTLLPDASVFIEGGRIAAVGSVGGYPPETTVIDGRGMTLMPGLIDSHVHAFSPEALRRAATAGVTTVLDMFTDEGLAARMRDEQWEGREGARADLFSAGVLATAPGGHGTEYGVDIPTVRSPADAREFVADRAAAGADFLKIVWDDGEMYGLSFATFDRATVAALIREAHAHRLKAVLHIGTADRARQAAELEADGIAHTVQELELDPQFANDMRRAGVFVIPTLTVVNSIVGLPEGATQLSEPSLRGMIGRSDSASLSAGFPRRSELEPIAINASRSVQELSALGGIVLAGTDAPNPGTAMGLTLHRELELLVQAGMSPLDALRAATLAPARAFGIVDRGRIAPGLRADVVLVRGDPSSDITQSRNIVGVWKAGRRVR